MNYVETLPTGTPHSLSVAVFSNFLPQIMETGKRVTTLEKADKHALSQVIKVNMISYGDGVE